MASVVGAEAVTSTAEAAVEAVALMVVTETVASKAETEASEVSRAGVKVASWEKAGTETGVEMAREVAREAMRVALTIAMASKASEWMVDGGKVAAL